MSEQEDVDAELLGRPEPFITEPGRYDIPDPIYHADPVVGGSLSSTGARTLLQSPAKFDYWRGKSQTKRAFDVGSAAHRLVLGTGPELVVVKGTGADENAWRTNADKAAVRKVRDAGGIPLHPEDYTLVHDMAEALQRNSYAAELLSGGTAEEAFFAVDPETGMWLRGKTDYRHADRRVLDYKTSGKPADADTFGRTMASFGYHIQFAMYRYLLVLLGLIEHRTPFLAIVQEKEPPYLVSVIQPDLEAMAFGHAEAMEALRLYQRHTATGEWPGYPEEIQTASLPGWKLKEYEDLDLSPVYTDRVSLALDRIATLTSRTEVKAVPIVFPDLKDHPDVLEAMRLKWRELKGVMD